MAFNTAITGLKASTIELDVTGNNIANASTVGFKSGRTEFADIFTTVVVGAGSTNNPGAGVIVSDIAQDFTAGTIEFTNNNLDLAIDGSGFFQLRDSQGGISYTRAGGFELDKDGNVVSKNGKFLQGFGLDSLGNQQPIQNLSVSQKESQPQSTSAVDLSFNIDSRSDATALLRPYDPDDASTYTFSNSSRIFDSLGNQHTLKLDVVEQPPLFERQTITFTTDTSGAGSTLSIAGVSIPVLAGETATQIRDKIFNQPAADPGNYATMIEQADSRIKANSIVVSGTDALTIDYDASAANVEDVVVSVTAGAYVAPAVTSADISSKEQQFVDIRTPSGAPGNVTFGGVSVGITAAMTTAADVVDAIVQKENEIIEQNPNIESIEKDSTNPSRINIIYRPELGSQTNLTFNDPGGTTQIFDDGAGGFVTGAGTATELVDGDSSYQGIYHLYAYLDGTELLDIGKATPPNGQTPSTEPGPIILEFNTTTGLLDRINGVGTSTGGTVEPISILGADPTVPVSERRRTSTANNPRNDLILDLSGTTQFASESIVKASTQDGFTKGDLIGVTFADDGTMVASFSNGQNSNLGVVVLATFENQGGLQPTGNTEWSATLESGQAILNPPGSGLNGALRSAALEQSNVDLSEELVALIEAQRNFQANSKTLQTENAVTQAILQIS